jgi:hypothetical protein
MPLVKHGKIAGDAFVRVADDAEIPTDGAVLISAMPTRCRGGSAKPA